MTLAGLYVYAIVTPFPAQRLIFMVLSMLLAFALWQKARDQLPYLLDPDASPPARVSTSDGLIATMLFFVAQGIAAAVIIGRGRVTGAKLLIAFSIGGAISYALMRYVYARAKTEGVPRILSEGSQPARCSASPAASRPRPSGSPIYLSSGRSDLLETSSSDSQSYASLGLWVMPLAVIAAPVFEEFIFRGLIFGGLRRSFGVWPATLASAAVFAILHPALAIAPGIRHGRLRGAGLRAHPQPAGADDRACRVQRLRGGRADSVRLNTGVPASVYRPTSASADPQVTVCS